MPSPNTISPDKLARLIGRPDSPLVIDVCTDEDFAANPQLVPGAVRRPWADVPAWGPAFVAAGRPAVIVCKRGLKLSHGVAAWLRHEGVPADALEGGIVAWQAAADRPGRAPAAPRFPGPNRLGDAQPAQGRSYRLSVADPSLRRPAGGVPLCRARGSSRRRRPFRCHAVRCRSRERALEPSRRALHLRSDGRRVRSRNRAAEAACDDRARCRHGATGTGSWPPRLACRACMPTILRSLRPGLRSTTPSIAGAAMPSTRDTTGRRPRGSHD